MPSKRLQNAIQDTQVAERAHENHPQCPLNGEEHLVTVERKSQERKLRERKSTDEEELEATAEKEIHPANDQSV